MVFASARNGRSAAPLSVRRFAIKTRKGVRPGTPCVWTLLQKAAPAAAAFAAASALAAVSIPAFADCPRVMSLNVCTDQLAMLIAAPGQLVSVSDLAAEPGLSYHHAMAARFNTNRGLAEEVFLARPDVVVTGTFSLHNTTALLKHLGFKVEEFDFSQSLATIPGEIRRMGRILGHPEKSEAMAAAFDAGLAAAKAPACGTAPTILAYGQNSVAVGADTLAHSVMEAAGFRNLAAELGYSGMTPFPLELLVTSRPDAIILSKPLAGAPALADQITQHPAVQSLSSRRIFLPEAAWTCGGPFTLEAVKTLRLLRDEIAPCTNQTGTAVP